MLISLGLMLTAVTPAASGPPPARPMCQDIGARHVGAAVPGKPHNLGDEPPAQRIFTVLRNEGGCSRPVLASPRLEGFWPLQR